MKQSIVLSKTIKIALIPMIKTITASNLPQNPQKQSWLTSNAPRESDYSTYFATLNCRIFCKKFASLIWQNVLQAIRFAHLAKGVTLQGQFCNFRFAQHLQNYFKCLLRSLFTNKFVYARDAHAQIRPLPRFFRLPNFVLLRAFMAGWMPLYLI